MIVVVAILISALLKTFVVRSFYIPSSSMESTLLVNDRIIVNELVPDPIPIERGDVVVFTCPANWLPPQPPAPLSITNVVDAALTAVGLSTGDSDDHFIKRVIGLPGDTVMGQSQATKSPFAVTVPAGRLWVMGDNRYNSADSAFHHLSGTPGGGFVPISSVVGRAFVVSWPTQRWAWLGNYPATFALTNR